MQDLINSMARFSAAMTLFGIQEMQNVVGAAMESPDYIAKFRQSLDSITTAIASELDATGKPALESVANLSNSVVERTLDTLKTPAFDPRQMLQTASDMIRKTADSLTKPIQKAAAASAAGEPQAAADVLQSK